MLKMSITFVSLNNNVIIEIISFFFIVSAASFFDGEEFRFFASNVL